MKSTIKLTSKLSMDTERTNVNTMAEAYDVTRSRHSLQANGQSEGVGLRGTLRPLVGADKACGNRRTNAE